MNNEQNKITYQTDMMYRMEVNGQEILLDQLTYDRLVLEGRTKAIVIDDKLFFVTQEIIDEMSKTNP